MANSEPKQFQRINGEYLGWTFTYFKASAQYGTYRCTKLVDPSGKEIKNDSWIGSGPRYNLASTQKGAIKAIQSQIDFIRPQRVEVRIPGYPVLLAHSLLESRLMEEALNPAEQFFF